MEKVKDLLYCVAIGFALTLGMCLATAGFELVLYWLL